MRKRRWMILGCAAVLAMASGCGSSQTAATTAAVQESSAAQSGGEEQTEGESVTVKVTAVDGNTVTAEVGELQEMGAGGGQPGGEKGERPEGGDKKPGEPGGQSQPGGEKGENPEGGDRKAGEPSARPNENGGNPGAAGNPSKEPDERDGQPGEPGGQDNRPEMPGDQNGQPGGSRFETSGEAITFTVSDDTTITVEYLQGSGEGTIDDIAAGSVLEVTLDDDSHALTVIVKNLNAGNGFGGSGEVTQGTSANTIAEDASVSGETYSSSGDDENALRVEGAVVTLDGISIEKSGGESSNTEDGDFYGQNAAFLATDGANVTISNATVNTSAVNGNGIFSYGEGTVVTISDSVIRTTQRNSGGIQTTGGGTTNASNLDIKTQGNSAAAIRSDRGGGTVTVDGGAYVTNGTGSPAVYCTADITVSDAVLTANASEGVVVEGKNSVTLKNCDVTASMDNTYNGDSEENIHAIMIYQSMSGDAEVGEAHFEAEGGSITAKTGDLFYITNTDCRITLKHVLLSLANDILFRIEGNTSSRGWGTQGANGGDVILTADSQKLEGNILVDDISSLDLTMKNGTELTGAINPDGAGGTVQVTLEEGSSWSLTADSYITEFHGSLDDISANGFQLYVNGEPVL